MKLEENSEQRLTYARHAAHKHRSTWRSGVRFQQQKNIIKPIYLFRCGTRARKLQAAPGPRLNVRLLAADSCEGEREKEAKKGRWEVSVRNASLLEDNPCAGPVCFKSNQSIRINYPCAPTPQYRVARAGTRTRGGWGVCVCVLCFLSHSHTPNPHVSSEKEPIKIKL